MENSIFEKLLSFFNPNTTYFVWKVNTKNLIIEKLLSFFNLSETYVVFGKTISLTAIFDAIYTIAAIVLGTTVVVAGFSLIYAQIKDRLSTLQKSVFGNVLFICFGVSLALYPLAGYSEGILTLLCINAIAAMGVSLLTGFTGVFSLGHAAYMALGAYTAAILTVRHGVHWLPGIIAGGIIAMVIAWAIGVPTLRLVGDYYTIASIGLGEAIRLILENWQSFTRGARGFPGITAFTTRYVAVGFFTVMGLLMFNLINSRHGREFRAARDDMIAASMMGFNITRIRVFSLMISAFYCGIAGALLAGFMTFIQPAMFDMMKSTELTSVVVFGGLGSMSGTLIGTSIITLITELFREISQYRMLIYGLILVLVMVFRPEGILGNREMWDFNADGILRIFFLFSSLILALAFVGGLLAHVLQALILAWLINEIFRFFHRGKAVKK